MSKTPIFIKICRFQKINSRFSGGLTLHETDFLIDRFYSFYDDSQVVASTYYLIFFLLGPKNLDCFCGKICRR